MGGLSHPRGERVEVFIPASDSCWFREEFVGDLLCSTGNSTQYSVITRMGKESEKAQVSVYV